VLSQEDEINKALKSRPKRRQRPGELQREQSLFINKDNLSSTPPLRPLEVVSRDTDLSN
jgi:hypothetical protein